MKYIKTDISYTFNPASSVLDFTATPTFIVNNLMAVINITTGNTMIYGLGVAGLGATVNGRVLTLQYSTVSMGANDTLVFIYDEGNDSLNDLLAAATGVSDPDASYVSSAGIVTRPKVVEDLLNSILMQLRALNVITLQASGLPDNLDEIISSVINEDA
jgi:hypothetical protein